MSDLLMLPNGRFFGALGTVDIRFPPILRMVPTRFSGLGRQLAAHPALFTLVTSLAAFGASSAMQAFRTPFSAATCSRQKIGGVSLKVLLVVAQLPDFPLSKFPEITVFGKACDGRTTDLGASKSKFPPVSRKTRLPPPGQSPPSPMPVVTCVAALSAEKHS